MVFQKSRIGSILIAVLLSMVGNSACGQTGIDLERLAETAVLQTVSAMTQEAESAAMSQPTRTPTPSPIQEKPPDLAQEFELLDASPTPAITPTKITPEYTGAIAFVSDRDGDLELYITNPAGSSTVRFSNNPGDDYAPVWSPGEAVLAYISSRPGGLALYLESVDHNFITRLSDTLASSIWDEPQVLSDDRMSWSPSGLIAFSSSRCAANCGEPPCPEIPNTFSGKTEEEAKRSMEIAIEKHSRCLMDWWDGQIYTVDVYGVNAGGKGESYLTFDQDVPIFDPAFSLTGDQFAATIGIAGGSDIYYFDRNGTSRTPLVVSAAIDHSPSLSPDGKWLAFVSNRDGNSEIYQVGTDGKNLERLTHDPSEDWSPTWSPDGSMIAFTSNRDGNHEIYTLDIENKTLANISNHPANDFGPSWTSLIEVADIPEVMPIPGNRYETRFDDLQAWFSYKVSANLEDAYALKTQSAKLDMVMNEPHGTVYMLFGKENTVADIQLQASFETMADSNRNIFNLVCRASDMGWYEFGMDSGGLWYIRKYQHATDEYNELGKGGSFSINMGAARNNLRASCKGSELTFWINDEQITAVSDSQFKVGYFGIGLAAFDNGNAHVMVNSFQADIP